MALLGVAWLAACSSDDLHIEAGACPGEGCRYGETWTAREAVALHTAPGESSRVIATLAQGERVETLGGEVHTRPGRFVVAQAREGYAEGEELLLYTYLGEGWFQVRHGGELTKADLGFGPYGRNCRTRDDERCWGVVEREAESWWWVRVRTASGREGWVLDSRALEKPGL